MVISDGNAGTLLISHKWISTIKNIPHKEIVKISGKMCSRNFLRLV